MGGMQIRYHVPRIKGIPLGHASYLRLRCMCRVCSEYRLYRICVVHGTSWHVTYGTVCMVLYVWYAWYVWHAWHVRHVRYVVHVCMILDYNMTYCAVLHALRLLCSLRHACDVLAPCLARGVQIVFMHVVSAYKCVICLFGLLIALIPWIYV